MSTATVASPRSPIGVMMTGDIQDVADLDRNAQVVPWYPDDFWDAIKQLPVLGYSHRVGETVITSAVVLFTVEETHILRYSVHPEHRASPEATMILKRFLDHGLRTHRLRVVADVPKGSPEVALYEACGFQVLCEYRPYYAQRGERVLVMARPCGEPPPDDVDA